MKALLKYAGLITATGVIIYNTIETYKIKNQFYVRYEQLQSHIHSMENDLHNLQNDLKNTDQKTIALYEKMIELNTIQQPNSMPHLDQKDVEQPQKSEVNHCDSLIERIKKLLKKNVTIKKNDTHHQLADTNENDAISK